MLRDSRTCPRHSILFDFLSSDPQPMEVPSTMNRRGTVTAVDIAIPNVGGEDNGDPHKFSKRRVCDKNGAVRIKYKNVSQRRRKFIKDIYTTLVDSS